MKGKDSHKEESEIHTFQRKGVKLHPTMIFDLLALGHKVHNKMGEELCIIKLEESFGYTTIKHAKENNLTILYAEKQ